MIRGIIVDLSTNMVDDAKNKENDEIAFSMRDAEHDDAVTVEEVAHSTQSKADESVLAELENNLVMSDDIMDEEKSGIVSEIQGILAELHLTPRQVIRLLVFFVLIVLLIIGSFLYLGNFLDQNPATSGDQFDTTVIDLTDNRKNDVIVEQDLKQPEHDVVSQPKPASNDPIDEEPGFWERFKAIFSGEDNVDKLVTEPQVEAVIQPLPVVDDTGTNVLEPTPVENNDSVPDQAQVNPIVAESVQIDVTGYARSIIRNIVNLGITQELDSSLSYYTRTYRRVRNIFNTDLFAYLENFADRKAGFDKFLGDFKSAYAESLFAFEELRQEAERLQETVIRLERERNFAEERYLAAQDDLASENLPDLLFDFQTVGSRYVVAHSEYKSRELLFARLEESLPIIEKKIKALEANEEAFVKGVQIIDFPDFNLDLIVPAE